LDGAYSPNGGFDFIGFYSFDSYQLNCTFPASKFLLISDKNQIAISNQNQVKILDFSDLCISDKNEDYESQVEDLYSKGLRQIEEGVFEAAEITFSNLFNLSLYACDQKTQIEALFYIGESRFLIGEDMFSKGLLYAQKIYEVVLESVSEDSPLRTQVINRLNPGNQSEEDSINPYYYRNSSSITDLEARLNQAISAEDDFEVAYYLRALGLAHYVNSSGNDVNVSYQVALNLFQRSLDTYEELDEGSGQAAVYHDMGDLQRRTGNYVEAVSAYQSAYQLYQQTGESEKIPLLLLYLGDVYYILEDDENALESYLEVVNLCRGINGECLNYNGQIFFFRHVSEAFERIGEIHLYREQYDLAFDFLRQSASFGNMKAINNIGRLYNEQRMYSEAIRFFQYNAQTPEDVLNCGGLGAPSRDDASIAASIRRGISESEMANNALRECFDAGIDSLLGQADAYRLSENYSRAIDKYRLVLETIFRLGNYGYGGFRREQFYFEDRRAIAQANMGLTYKEIGEYDSSLRLYRSALSIRQGLEDIYGQAILFNNIGEIYRNQGDYAEAEAYYQQALVIFEEGNQSKEQASVLHNFGVLYDELGQPERALDYYQQALVLRESVNDQRGQSETLSNMGLVYQALGDFDQAEQSYQAALALQQQQGYRHSQASTLNNLALLYIAKDQSETALELLNNALALYQELDNRVGEGNTLDSLGTAYASLGRYADAERAYQAALGILRETGNRAIERITLSNLGDLYQQQNDSELAMLFYKQSVNVTEAIRQDLQSLSVTDQQSYTEVVSDTYRSLVQLLLAAGRIPEAQQVLDLLKLEELREFTDTRAVWTSDGLQLTAAEQTVADAHGSLIALGADVVECERTNCPDIETLYDRQQTLLAQYDREVARFTNTIRDNRGDDGIFQDPESISGDAQDLLEAYAAEGETALLIYPFVLEDKLWLVWATVGNVIGSIEVPVARGDLSATVQRLGELLQTGDTRNIADLQATSQQLYDWLIAPLEGELAANDIDHLVFVNDRVTRYIPMAVLHDGDQYLLERYTLSTVLAPGATEMGDRLGPVPETPVLGLGVTRPIRDFNALPAVGPELAAIVQGPEGDGVYPGQVFLDEAFTLDALERNVADHRVLHIATHAEFVPGRKEESYILLGDGSPLRIPDIERIERRLNNLHLVVLSACQTALGGPDQDGAEIAGLSSYFLEARRAEAVIASLWSVNDTSTSVLMQRFYALLATGDFTKSEALRQAQLSLLNGEDLAALADRLATTRAGARPVLEAGTELPPDIGHRHPYHWAPFILIGNGL
jgi:CHAT domain-containing protein/Tfp pilus assembly protein PilF